MKRALEPAAPLSQESHSDPNLPHEPRQIGSPWMNTHETAVYLRYTGKHPLLSVYKFIKRHGIITRHDGSRLLLDRHDVECALWHGRHHRAPAARVAMTVLGTGR